MSNRDDSNLGRFLGLGLQIAIGAVIGYVVGSWLDRRYGWTPNGALIGSMLGVAGGLYLLIKEALKANKD